MSRITQKVTKSGNHLVLTLTETATGKVLARRVWEDAAKYVTGTQEYVDSSGKRCGHIAIELPLEAALEFS